MTLSWKTSISGSVSSLKITNVETRNLLIVVLKLEMFAAAVLRCLKPGSQYDRRRSHSIVSDRPRLYVNSSVIVCDRLRSSAIKCDHIVNKVLRSCDWNVSHNATFSQRAALKAA